MFAIETTNLSRSFKGKPAVKSLNMHVPKGSIYGFIVQNGAGKSTTQKMICGLLQLDARSSGIGTLSISTASFTNIVLYKIK